MRKKSVLISFVCVFGILCVSGALFMGENTEQEEISIAETEETKTAEKEDIKNVSVQSGETEVYILRFRTQSDTVELVTKKTDGTQIITPVESIKPYYLTDGDIKALKEGIETQSREDMYILIEDLSS